jgi:hypothetical protein
MEYNIQKIEHIAPKITWNRFDLAFKIAYLEELDKGVYDGFGNECYSKHIDAFSLGDFTEPGTPEKNSLQKYLDTFEKLNSDIKTKGFDIGKGKIPLATDGSILNGAHRTSIGLHHNLLLPVNYTDIEPQKFDYKYFKSRGLNEEQLDFAALKYIENSNEIYLAIIWPRANCEFEEIEHFFSKVIYSKRVSLNYNGAHNLLAEAYEGEPWLGNKNENYPGIRNKLIECFPNFKPISICLFHEKNIEQALLVKDKIRKKFNVGKHAIHITDNDHESYSIAKLLFNYNSIHYLNNAKPNLFKSSIFDKYVCNLADCRDHLLPILGPNVTLSLYGFHNSERVDMISDLDNKVLKNYTVTDEQPQHTFNSFPPRYYFYHKGVKCLALQEVIKNYGRISNVSSFKQNYIKLNMLYKFSVNKMSNILFCNINYLKLKFKIKFREKLGLFLRKLGISEILKKVILYFRGS